MARKRKARKTHHRKTRRENDEEWHVRDFDVSIEDVKEVIRYLAQAGESEPLAEPQRSRLHDDELSDVLAGNEELEGEDIEKLYNELMESDEKEEKEEEGEEEWLSLLDEL